MLNYITNNHWKSKVRPATLVIMTPGMTVTDLGGRNMARPRTIIVGGGLSGLCLAHGLLARGNAVTVFERDAGRDVRGQGYRLTIDGRGREALRASLPQRNYEFIRATAGRAGKTGAFVFLDDRARELTRFSFDLEDQDRRGHITGQVDRGVLRQALLSGLEDHTRFV